MSPKSKSTWVHTIMDLPPLIMMGNKKQGVGSENKKRPFWMHDASRFNLTIPTEIGRPCFFSLPTLG